MGALLYFAIGFLAVVAATRAREMSRGAAAALLLLPLVLTAGALFTGDVYGPVDLAYTAEPLASIADGVGIRPVVNPSISDVYAEFMPWNDALRRAIRAGEWPLWNPYELSGTPLAGAAQVAPYHPVTLFGLLVPLPAFFGFAAAMLYLVAAISAFLLARELTDSEPAALFAAAGWMASTHLVFFAGTAMAHAVSVTPLVLLGARRIVHEPGRRSAMILGVALLLLVLSGHPETALHVVFFAVSYFAFQILWGTGAHNGERRPVTTIVVSGLAAGIGALLLSAFFLLPHLDVISQSEEYAHRAAEYEQTSASAAQIVHRLTANFFPFLEGAPGIEEPLHPAAVRHGWLPTAYAGALLLPLALLGLVRARSRERWFFAGAVVWGFGSGLALPGLTQLLNVLPGFDIAVNDRMIVFATLGTCMLAARGIAAVQEREAGSPALFLIGFAILVAAGAYLIPSGVSPDYRLVGAIRAIAPMLLAAGAVIVLPARVVAAALIGLLLLQRAGETASLQPTVPKRAFYPPFPGLELLKAEEPFRIVATGTMLPPAISTHYGLEDARGFQAVTLARYDQTYPLWSRRQPVWSNRVDDLNSPFLSALNVRYAFVTPEATLPSWWTRIGRFGTYDIAENQAVVPRAWVPRAVRYTTSLFATLVVFSGIRDFRAESTIEDDRSPTGLVPNGPGAVSIYPSIRGRGTHLRLRARMERDGWVIVSNAFWRGWQARMDGERLPVRYGNHAFIAVRVPAGTHDVELTYRPRSFVVGSLISIVAAIVILLFYTGILSSAITFFMSFQTSFFAPGVRRR